MNGNSEGNYCRPDADVLIKIGENMVQNCAVGFFVIDSHHHVIHWNRACEELTGIKAADVIGTSKSRNSPWCTKLAWGQTLEQRTNRCVAAVLHVVVDRRRGAIRKQA